MASSRYAEWPHRECQVELKRRGLYITGLRDDLRRRLDEDDDARERKQEREREKKVARIAASITESDEQDRIRELKAKLLELYQQPNPDLRGKTRSLKLEEDCKTEKQKMRDAGNKVVEKLQSEIKKLETDIEIQQQDMDKEEQTINDQLKENKEELASDVKSANLRQRERDLLLRELNDISPVKYSHKDFAPDAARQSPAPEAPRRRSSATAVMSSRTPIASRTPSSALQQSSLPDPETSQRRSSANSVMSSRTPVTSRAPTNSLQPSSFAPPKRSSASMNSPASVPQRNSMFMSAPRSPIPIRTTKSDTNKGDTTKSGTMNSETTKNDSTKNGTMRNDTSKNDSTKTGSMHNLQAPGNMSFLYKTPEQPNKKRRFE